MALTTRAAASRDGRWGIPENATVYLQSSRFATVVRIERGTMTFTREGDLEDLVLESGEEILIPVGGRAIVWALTEAVISVREATPAGSNLGSMRLGALA